MLVKTIKYVDYDGNERTEQFRFNLTKSELAEMEVSKAGGLGNTIQKIVEEQDKGRIIELFKEIILKSYGEKSADGKRFEKSPELSLAFSQTEAYNILFMELVSDADLAAAFVNGVLPQMK